MLSWLFFKRYLFSVRAGSLVKRIAWLSILSVGMSVASFIIVLSVMSGLHHNINLRILALEPHLVAEFDKNTDESQLMAHPIVAESKKLSSIELQLFDRQDVILRTVDGVFHGAIARGVTAKTVEFMIEKLSELPKASSNTYSPNFEIPGGDEVILGSGLAKQMNVFEGDHLTVLPPESLLMAPGDNPPFSRVLVKQIVSTNIAELDSQMVLFQRGQALQNFSKAGSRRIGFDLWLKEPSEAPKLKTLFAKYKDLKIETWIDRNSAVFLALKLEKLMLGSFLGLSALITTFSIWSVLTLLITQKRKEMGLLMALGFSNLSLRELFEKVGLYLAGFGLGLGSFIGLTVALYLEKNPLNVLPDIYYDSEVPARVDFIFITTVLIVAITIIYSAIRLAMSKLLTLKPADALRNN